jgi:hypothetical protein
MNKKILILLLVLFLSACYALNPPEPPPTPTDTPRSSPTETIVWFPPSATPEPAPTIKITPTEELRSEIGEIVFEDDFMSSGDWTVPQTDRGAINISGGEINIIINEPKSFLVGTREKPDLSDFYAEITVNPVLCSGDDEYGFLFRVFGREQYYRLTLTCDGEIRMDKLVGGLLTNLQPLMRSGSVPVGAPSISNLGVFALQGEIRIFINGDPQFTVIDRDLKVGSFGVYARSNGDTALTVSYSDLIVRELVPK